MLRERGVQRANALVCVAALLLAAAVGIEAWAQFRAAGHARLWVHHTYQVLGTVKDLQITLDDAEDEQRGFMLSGEEQDRRSYRRTVEQIGLLQAALRGLTSDNPSQAQRLSALAPLVERKLGELARVIEEREKLGAEPARRSWSASRERQVNAEIDPILAGFTAEE